MIWEQDNDPTPDRDDWDGPVALHASWWPTCQQLWEATAHEAADTVVQILCGDGITYGLGRASAGPWQPLTLAGVTRERPGSWLRVSRLVLDSTTAGPCTYCTKEF